MRGKGYRIHIVGGAGPQAGILLHSLIIQGLQSRGAWRDKDFPEIIHHSYPFSDMLSPDDSSLAVAEEINALLKTIEEFGSSLTIVACQTLHLFFAANDYPTCKSLLEIIREDQRVTQSTNKIRAVASANSIQMRLHDEISDDIKYLDPVACGQAVEQVLKGDLKRPQWLQDQCDKRDSLLLLGCTEFSLYFDKQHDHIIDPIRLAADYAVDQFTRAQFF